MAFTTSAFTRSSIASSSSLSSLLSSIRSFSLSSVANGAIKNVAIVGGGQMGSGIAQVSAAAGQSVVVVDIDQGILDNSRKVITNSLARVAKKKHKDDADAATKMVDDIVGKISWTKSVEEAVGASDLVVEAIVENLDIKKKLFAGIDAAAPPNTILASNTSSLSIGDIASATNRQDKFVGLHFFNPVPVMKLLEVVKTDMTDPEVFDKVTTWGKELGKTTVPCKDTPGFVVNRLLVPFLFEAVRMVERGDATPADVDVAMKLGAGHPMGPFELFDYIGHDTMDLIMQGWSGRYPEENLFRRSETVMKLVSEGKLGKKTGEGFYKY